MAFPPMPPVPPPIPSTPPLVATEPVALAEAARTLLAVLVGLGWITLDDTTFNAIATVVGVLASWGLSWLARRHVTPTAKAP